MLLLLRLLLDRQSHPASTNDKARDRESGAPGCSKIELPTFPVACKSFDVHASRVVHNWLDGCYMQQL
jgi:hypothetical protein